MANRYSRRLCLLLLGASLTIGGCLAESDKTKPVLNPLTDPNIVVPDYVAGAIEAAGGAEAWARTDWIRADCVVAFYGPDLYLTRHHYDIRPWPPYISINAVEPEGKFTWTLTPEGFTVLDGDGLIDSPHIRMVNRGFAASLLYLVTAPVHLRSEAAYLNRAAEPVKTEGRWYYAIEKVAPDGQGAAGRKIVFYQNAQSSLVEMVWLAGTALSRARYNLEAANSTMGSAYEAQGGVPGDNEHIIIKGYDYVKIDKTDVLVPSKVEIFKSLADGRPGQRLAKVDFKNLQTGQKTPAQEARLLGR